MYSESLQLADEFSEFVKCPVLHVHSGHKDGITRPAGIRKWCQTYYHHKLIFTTYHSLHRIIESGVRIDTIYYDESHNSVRRDFFESVKTISNYNYCRQFFFTATPVHSFTDNKPGMNDTSVYGGVIAEVTAREMVEGNYILPPQLIVTTTTDPEQADDTKQIISSITGNNLDRILVCCRSTAQLEAVVGNGLRDRMPDYDIFYITSKTGAIINGQRVERPEFFKRLRNHTGKFILLHRSILSEGINLKNLDSCVILRSMNIVDTLQTVGRVIRKGEGKLVGKVVLPSYDKYTKKYTNTLQNIIRSTFEEGVTPVKKVTR